MGQESQGMEPHQLQAEDQPSWSHWLLELCYCFPWWFIVCIRWQGWQSNVVGSQRRQTFVHSWQWRDHQCLVFQPQQILALRCCWLYYQDLGSWKQINSWRSPPRRHRKERQPTRLSQLGLVCWWSDSLCWLLWQPHQGLAGVHHQIKWRPHLALILLHIPYHFRGQLHIKCSQTWKYYFLWHGQSNRIVYAFKASSKSFTFEKKGTSLIFWSWEKAGKWNLQFWKWFEVENSLFGKVEFGESLKKVLGSNFLSRDIKFSSFWCNFVEKRFWRWKTKHYTISEAVKIQPRDIMNEWFKLYVFLV